MPYPSFIETARVLDTKRLGKQKVETLQIMTALLEGRGWIHHPAVKMWMGYEQCLLQYQTDICYEWIYNRGFKDTCLEKTQDIFYNVFKEDNYQEPFWLGADDFHEGHQSNLIRKDPEYYGNIFADVSDNLPYVWPV